MSDRFCERCGAALAVLQPAGEGGPGAGAVGPGEGGAVSSVAAVRTAAPPSVCPSCGASDGVDADGFCLSCGVRSVRPRDRMECDLGAVVAVSDKGPHKARNEDSFAVALLEGGGFVLSVCDGVSNIARSDEASQAACAAAVATLAVSSEDGASPLMVRAASAASAAVVAVAPMAVGADPPSCTFLAARWQASEGLTVGWLGDCRAYLVTGSSARQLTTDHSWGSEAVRAGVLSQQQADADGRSHAITRWLGADAGIEPLPDLVGEDVDPASAALVVAVSDGAWNYLGSADELATFFTGVTLLEGARRLTEHAIASGGHDNITVVAGRLAAPTPTPDPATSTEPV